MLRKELIDYESTNKGLIIINPVKKSSTYMEFSVHTMTIYIHLKRIVNGCFTI